MTIYLLIMFALKTRYTHADFHAGNIMVNPDDDTYFDGIKGSVILIDFGAVRTIPDDKYEKIKEILFENKAELQYILPTDISLDESQATEGITIPFHDGAAVYYEEHGISMNEE